MLWNIPMDCDDNDSQSQNFHLTGEGSTKFPPALLPYALPKFDFDDSLQGHLRFDSLVEAEVFLGIESNEDNQWIEDFSRGNPAIGFSSSGTEACSISRNRNVWSEAASSESVEILLKSVGQEEINTGKSIVKELEASDDLDCLVEKMEPSLKGDDNILSKTGDVMEMQPALVSSKLGVNSSGMKEGPLVEDAREENKETCHASQTNELSFGGHSTGLDPNAAGGKESNASAAEGGSFSAAHCDDKSRANSDILEDKSLDNWMSDVSALALPIDDKGDSQPQNKSLSPVEANRHEVSLRTDDKIDNYALETENCQEGAKHHVLGEEVQIGSQDLEGNRAEGSVPNLGNSLCPDSMVEHATEGDAGKNVVLPVEKTSLQTAKGDGVLHVEVCGKVLCPPMPSQEAKEGKSIAVSGDMQITGDSIHLHHQLPSSLESNVSDGGIVTEKGKTNDSVCASTEPHDDHIPQIGCSDQEDYILNCGEITAKTSISKSEALLTAMDKCDDYKSEDSSGSRIQGIGLSSSDVSRSSSELHGEPNATGTLTDTSGPCKGDRRTESVVPSSTLSDLQPKCADNTVDRQRDDSKHANNLHDSEDQSTELATDAIKEDGQDCTKKSTSKNSVSSLLAESDEHNILEPKLKSEAGNELGSAPSEKENTVAGEVSSDVPTPVASQVTNEIGLVSDKKEVATGDYEGKQSHENVNQALSVADTDSQMLQKEAVSLEVVQGCEKMMDVCPALSNSAANKDNDNKEAAVTVRKQEEAINEKKENPSNMDVALQPLTSKSGEFCHDKGPKDIGTTSASDDKEDIGEAAVLMQHNADDSLIANGQSTRLASVSEPDIKLQEAGGVRSDEGFKNAACGSTTVTKPSEHHESCEKKKEAGISADVNSKVLSVPADPSRAETANKSSVSPPASILSSPVSLLKAVEKSPSTSGLNKMGAHDVSHGTPLKSVEDVARSGPRGTSERKTRRSCGKAGRKETVKKGNSRDESTPVKQSGQGKKANNMAVSPSGICTPTQHGVTQNLGNVDCGSGKLFGLLTTSSIPDLNSLASPSTRLQQPFSDMQQVQLRAQIYVYGALIQGKVPDEACMLSAFGGPDGGRSSWESAWRTSKQRLQDQESHSINPETPLQSHPGSGVSDQKSKPCPSQNKVISTPTDCAGSKGTPTTVKNPMIPLSSPLWNIPTPSCDALHAIGMPRGPVLDFKHPISSLHPYQMPPMRNFVGHNPLMSQSPIRGPWIVSPQISAADSSIRPTAFLRTEKVQLTPIMESTVQHSSGTLHISPGSVVHSGVATNMYSGTSPLVDSMKVVTSAVQQTESKPRKRKKSATSEEPARRGGNSQQLVEPVSVPTVKSLPSVAVGSATPSGLVSKDTTENFILSGPSPSTFVDHTKKLIEMSEKKSHMSEEVNYKVKEARQHAESAAAFAANTINHCQEIWGQLHNQQTSGFAPNVESTIASAVAAIAAATSVAKAAAEAAKVASNAALQAKLMAEGALELGGYGSSDQGNGGSVSEGMNRGKASPASVLKGEAGTPSSNPIIIAAKEAARKRIEAATTASRQAENMDAIVKAAELAAEAVSQAGIIVAMGEPISLNKLVKDGPEGFWKTLLPPITGANNSDMRNEQACASREIDNQTNKEDGTSGPVATTEKDSSRAKGPKVSEVAKTIGVVLGSEDAARSSITSKEYENKGNPSVESSITEGSLVEVLKNGHGLKAAWYQASVLDLRDGKALVSYNELKSDEGSESLKEWVSINGEDDVPRIRVARPVLGTNLGGTRKRRRAAMGDYNWSAGDKVDAWIQDSWCEGIVKEKSKNDNTMFTVQFTALGQTFDVKAWHIRPSLIWKDGKWTEWSRSSGNERPSFENDSPQQKRMKMGTSAVEGKNEVSKDTNVMESGKPDDARLLDLAANEKTFNIGKSSRDEDKNQPHRTIRTNLKKEGSRVVFGVPKPGKKRKFMEVSKHYTDQGAKAGEGNESVKFARYLMPQKPGSRGSKGSAKGDLKSRQVPEPKPRVPKSGKLQNNASRTVPQRGKVSESGVSAPGESSTEHNENIRESTSNMENMSEGTAEGPFMFSSEAPSTDEPVSRKPSSSNRIARANKGKLAPAGPKLAKVEEKVSDTTQGRATSEVVEPRRSNRKIQPTSRLLEGLQSSLFISKIPSVSHDRHRNQNRNASRGSSHG